MLTEIEAAIRFKFSPTLLRWFTQYGVKSVKLKFSLVDNLYHYELSDLNFFNILLKDKWSEVGEDRPAIPKGIRDEITREASLKCAFCLHPYKGEIAHIEDYAISKNHHPENLIFLCDSHHGEYDSKDPNCALMDRELVNTLKRILVERQLRELRLELAKERIILRLIQELEFLYTELKSKPNKEVLDLIQKIIDENTIRLIKNINIIEKNKLVNSDYQKLASEVKKSLNSKNTTNENFEKIKKAKVQYLENSNEVTCKICLGNGSTNFYGCCPACKGLGLITKNKDTETYYGKFNKLKNCKTCKGLGFNNIYDHCPACNGEGKIPEFYYDSIDFTQYDELCTCLTCNGKGSSKNYDHCPACNGEGRLPKFIFDKTDFSKYDMCICETCKGKGSTKDYDACPPCNGHGKLPKYIYDNTDFTNFNEFINCDLCKGKGFTSRYDECPPCEGRGKLSKIDYNNANFIQYSKMLQCRSCKGKGYHNDYDCSYCDGEGEIPEAFFYNIDWDDL